MSAAPATGTPPKTPEDIIARIRRHLGEDAVLLAVANNAKKPIAEGWQKFTAEKMRDPEYLETLYQNLRDGGNIGVANRGDRHTIDIDGEAEVEPFLAVNPKLTEALRTKRVRGCNIWLRVSGNCPKATVFLKTKDGRKWGEWRGDGSQTVFYGQAIQPDKGETTRTKYKIVHGGPVLEIAFEEIVWPDNLIRPWVSGAPAETEREESAPFGGAKPDKSAVRSMLAVIPKRSDYPDWLRIVAAVGDALNANDAVEVLKEWSPEECPGEYLEKLNSGMERVHIGTLIYLAKQAGWDGIVWSDPEPLPPEHPPVAPFDYAMLPASFEAYVRDVAERMQCPPDYVAVGLLCAAGCLVGRKIGIHPKRKDDWLEVCNLWGAVVGPPSVMKTPALKEAMLPLNKLVAEAIERHKAALAEYAENKEIHAAGKDERKRQLTATLKEKGESAARDMVRERASDTCEEPKCERFIVSDCTCEKLAMLLNENPNGLLQFRDELAGWLRSMDKDGHENDRAFLLECWNGRGGYVSDRVGRGTLHVEAAIVSVLGGIQPGVLAAYVREAVTNGTGSDGLLQRFGLVVWPECSPAFTNVDRYPDRDAKEAVMEVFRRLHKLTAADLEEVETDYSDIPALRLTDEAQDRFDEWREQFENGLRSSPEHPAVVAHLTKHRKLVPVLTLLIHLIDGGTGRVGLEPLNRALRWHDYLVSHAAKVYGGLRNAGASPAREILRRICEGEIKDGFTAREIYRRHWSGLDDTPTVHAGLDALTVASYLREVSTPTAGKPMVRYRIHPKVLGTPEKPVPKVPKAAVDYLPWPFGTNGTPVLDAKLLHGLEPIDPPTMADPAFQ